MQEILKEPLRNHSIRNSCAKLLGKPFIASNYQFRSSLVDSLPPFPALNPRIPRNHHHWHWFLPNPPLLENNAEAMGVEIGAGEHETMTMVVLL